MFFDVAVLEHARECQKSRRFWGVAAELEHAMSDGRQLPLLDASAELAAPFSPQLEMLRAAEEAAARVREPGSPNTERAYKIARNRWANWCALHGFEVMPIRPERLVTHLEQLSKGTHLQTPTKPASPRTVRLALSALASFDQASRITQTDKQPASIRLSPIVRRWLTSWSRSVKKRKPRKAPAVTRAELLSILRAMYVKKPPRGVTQRAHELARMRDRALLLIGWLGCLRRGEIAGLLMGDVVEVEKGIELTLQHTKTNQDGPPDKVDVHRQQNSEMCAVEAWRVWCMVLSANGKASPTDPLFPRVHPSGTLEKQISEAAVAEVIVRRAADGGFPALGHSLRRGFATESSNQRKPESWLQKHGRWRSTQIVREYQEDSDRWSQNPTEGIT